MSSIIEGYNYDIFISYRQKDNKGDHWVSEFVEALKTELESTFKEEISVYFDINPHDGLLETHDVDASLKEKLKCLIFIPIISRTYCDLKSFAWEHEFKAFVEMASKDQFGLKVKLPNGNVGSRVLPVRIHELENEDIKNCELLLGSVLRGIEFIYKEPGVNKPLSKDDAEETNHNKTRYRIQINKVANSISDILSGMQKSTVHEEIISIPFLREQKTLPPLNKKNWISMAAIIIILASILYGLSRIRGENSINNGELSVAVIPFRNLTNNSAWDIWQDGIQIKLTMHLSDYPGEIFVNQPESVNTLYQSTRKENYATLTPDLARNLSKKLGVKVFIYGSILQTGDVLYLNAQLIETGSQKILKSFETHTSSSEDSIFHAIEPLCKQISNYLIVSKLGDNNQFTNKFKSWNNYTNSTESYRYYLQGLDAFLKSDWPAAQDLLLKSYNADTTFSMVKVQLAFAYGNAGNYPEAKKWTARLRVDMDSSSPVQKELADYIYAHFFETPNEEIPHLKGIIEMDDKNPINHWQIGDSYLKLNQYENALMEMNKALSIFDKLKSKPMWDYAYTFMGYAYHKLGQFNKEKRIYKKAQKDFPDSRSLAFRQAVLALSEGDSIRAKEYMDKYFLLARNNVLNESDKNSYTAIIYDDAELPDKAEYYYRLALLKNPENDYKKYKLGNFLIERDRNIEEGVSLIKQLLEVHPEDYRYLNSFGRALYKKRQFSDALTYLQKSWDLRMKHGIYDHTAFLNLEEAKKAVMSEEETVKHK